MKNFYVQYYSYKWTHEFIIYPKYKNNKLYIVLDEDNNRKLFYELLEYVATTYKDHYYNYEKNELSKEWTKKIIKLLFSQQ